MDRAAPATRGPILLSGLLKRAASLSYTGRSQGVVGTVATDLEGHRGRATKNHCNRDRLC
jgi:hypothetical protein